MLLRTVSFVDDVIPSASAHVNDFPCGMTTSFDSYGVLRLTWTQSVTLIAK
jgi:hypothetical protein